MGGNSVFALAGPEEIAARKKERIHIRKVGDHNVVCVTDRLPAPKDRNLGAARARAGDRRFDIVVDASEGFVPLWAEHSKLRWRFNAVSLEAFADPAAAKEAIRALFDDAVAAWDTACPVAFVEDEALYDFEIVVRSQKRCSPNGCVLASAFFPDGGQHELLIYPSMFEQSHEEQVATLVHEIGHIFGLRHFFALISEGDWPSIIYGGHEKFSIMNYGDESVLTDLDRTDLANLYRHVWEGRISALNGTPVRLVRPYSSGFL
jgi:hypothetical protein